MILANGHCQRFIAHNFPGRCMFQNILDFVNRTDVAPSKRRLEPNLTFEICCVVFFLNFNVCVVIVFFHVFCLLMFWVHFWLFVMFVGMLAGG